MAWDIAELEPQRLLIVGRAADDAYTATPHPALRQIWMLLGLRDLELRGRMETAIREAMTGQQSSILVTTDIEGRRSVLTVRAAREPGRVVVTTEPLAGAGSRLDLHSLRLWFELSPSEAEVALSLARGASLMEIAHERGVQHETVRGQVKTVLRKVGVPNQKQLSATFSHLGALVGTLANRPFVDVA